jgi:sporulation integral membrane protein YlbJ
MMKQKRSIRAVAALLLLAVLIFDSARALAGAAEGVELCVRTVIPSLFPFFVCTMFLTENTGCGTFPLPGRILAGLRIPKAASCVWIPAFLGGYPVGAKCIGDLYGRRQISRSDAQRLLAFCSNAGPSFIFGITAAAFSQAWMPWLIWGIHLLSAVITARILPPKPSPKASSAKRSISIQQALDNSLKTMARVCGWIILFRVVIAFCNRWFIWYFGTTAQIAFNGLLELTIGCTALGYIPNTGLRMILCTGFLSFGGLCVLMQTRSVCAGLGFGNYVLGKSIQTVFSILLAALAQFVFLPPQERVAVDLRFGILMAGILAVLVLFPKKGIAFRRNMMYNHGIRQKQEDIPCSLESASKSPAPTAASAPGSTRSRSFAPKKA